MKSYIEAIMPVICAFGLVYCGAADEEDSELQIAESIPDDSTGTKTDLSLDFGYSNSASLEDSLTISENIVITDARFNIAAIKIKAAKEESEEEKDLKKIEKDEEADAIEDVDDASDATTLTAEDTNPCDSKFRKNWAKKKAKLSEKEESRSKKESERDLSTKFIGPYVYNALSSTLDPKPDEAEVADGSYRRIQFKLKRNWSATDTDPLLGNVMVIAGNYINSGITTPFQVRFHNSMNFMLRGAGTFTANTDDDNALKIVFNVANWFDEIDLFEATQEEDSSYICISHNSNKRIHQEIRKNIKKHIKFGKDDDADGELSDDETAGDGEASTGDIDDE